jgi:uncharacterized protein (PEP-CTERM system associated)
MTANRTTFQLLSALGLCLPLAVTAQYQAAPAAVGNPGTDAGARVWSVVPRIGMALTATDNVDLASTGERSETILELSPGLRVQAAGRTLTGYLDYQRREFHYTRDTSPRRSLNQLNAFGSLEAIEDTLAIDVAGSVSEQAVSAFGPQGSAFTVNANKAENRVFSVSPVLTGQLGGYLDYSARFAATAARSDSSTALGDSDSRDWSGQIGSGSPIAQLSWALSGTSQQVRFASGRESEADSATARVFWQTSPQLRLWVSGGRESNNYLTVDRESETTRGAGFEWAPSPRTQLQAGRERRFFGDSDTVAFSHRSGRSTLRFDHSRSVSSPSDNLAADAGIGRIYDLVDAQFASRIPDPAERASAVDEFLASRGIAPDTQVTSGFLSARVFVQRASTLSLMLTGVRNTVVVSGSRTESESLGNALLGDDFDAFQQIRQTGVSASWTLTLSPRSALSLGGSRQRTTGEGTTAQQTTLTTVQTGLTLRPGPRTAMTVRLQRSEAADSPQPYVEKSATLSLTYSL